MTADFNEQLKLYFTRVVRSTSPTPPDEDLWLVPDRMLTHYGEPGDSDAVFRVGGRGAVRLAPPAIEAAEIAARTLLSHLGLQDQAQVHDIVLEVYEAAARVRLGRGPNLDQVLGELVASLGGRLGRSFLVAGLAGVEIRSSVHCLGTSMVLGHMSEECIAALQELAVAAVGRGFPLSPSIDAWWTEDWLATTEDPSLREEIEQGQRFHTPVAGVVVDAVGSTATYRALEAIEALLGAVWILQPLGDWRTWPPTILGAPTVAEAPRSPDHLGEWEDGLVAMELLYVDSRGLSRPAKMEWRPSNADVDSAVSADEHSLLKRVADSHRASSRGRTSRRLAAACRFLLNGARASDPGSALLNSAIALEALVGDHQPGSGATRRFTGRLKALLPGIEEGLLSDLYAMRSEVAHQGYSEKPFEGAARLATEALGTAQEAIIAANRLTDAHDLDREDDYLNWIS